MELSIKNCEARLTSIDEVTLGMTQETKNWTVDIHEDPYFALQLNGEHEALPCGDFKLEIPGRENCVLIERKTWTDAYSSFRTRRIEDQLARMLIETPNAILLIEGNQNSLYTNDKNQLENLISFLNRMSAEICPVVYTTGTNGTARYLKALEIRVASGEYGRLVRKPTIVASSRNKHHALLESIPGIGRASAKKLHTMFDSLADFISQINNADPETSPLVSQIGPAKFEKLKAFVDAKWPNKPAERQVLKTYAEKEE